MVERLCKQVSLALGLVVLVTAGCSSKGAGADPAECEITVTSLDFGEVGVGGSAELSFTIRNTGGSTLTGTVTSPCDDFAVTKNAFYSLTANQSVPVTITFAPTAAGESSCVIETGSSECDDVTVTGTGGTMCCSVSPEVLDFLGMEPGTQKDTSFTITNCGLESISGNVTIACDRFSIVSGGGAWSLGVGQSHTVTVRLAPDVAGDWSCMVDPGFSSGTANCDAVNCIGESGEIGCQISPNPNPIDFDSVLVGTERDTVLTIRNFRPVRFSGRYTEASSCDADDFGIESGFVYDLDEGETGTIRIRFIPRATGERECIFQSNTDVVTLDGSDPCTAILVRGIGYEDEP